MAVSELFEVAIVVDDMERAIREELAPLRPFLEDWWRTGHPSSEVYDASMAGWDPSR
ncbi:hypothetical protein [Nocardioides humi]|uniref:Uncharacterized protein n=1 Tax=Nocardioides humi TaxID=449461 RepID=A0ABN2BFQ2_9ACTN|nr:hypothetical protein [Nocardioides humi]